MKEKEEIVCLLCRKKFNIDKLRLRYKKSQGQKNFFCSRKCSLIYSSRNKSINLFTP